MTNEEQAGALAALTILELSEGVAGPFAAKLFADYGARVIKVERPGQGDRLRLEAPGSDERFAYLNTNKLSLTLDYETPAGASILAHLAEEADGLIEDRPGRRRDGLGLDAMVLIDSVPRLVICGVSPFAETGPYAGRPFRELGPGAELKTGLHAFVAMLGALWNAAQTEHDQVVEVCGFEAIASTLGAPLAHALWERTRESTPAAFEAAIVAAAAAPERFGEVRGPFEMAKTPRRAGRAPALGEHTDYVLGDLIGLEAAEIEALRREGVV